MQSLRLALIAAAFLISGPAAAQNWFMFEDKSEFFTVNFPEEPTVTEITFDSESGLSLPAKRYEASDGATDYSVTVVNYNGSGASITETLGGMAWAAWDYRKRGGEITFDGYTQIDRIEGHQMQINNEDGSRTFVAIHRHDGRLFILDATTPAGMPPPLHFQNSIGIFDQEGMRVRYEIDINGQTKRWYRGGAYGEDPDSGIADLYDVYEELEYQRELAAQAAQNEEATE
jgi:hypothetical protein